MKRLTILLLCASLLSGCASSGALRTQEPRVERPSATVVDAAVLAEFAQNLPVGTNVRISRAKGGSIAGILLKVTEHSIIVQRRTRRPEPPEEIPLDQIANLTPEMPNAVAKAIGIGAAVGAGAALGVFLIILAIYAG